MPAYQRLTLSSHTAKRRLGLFYSLSHGTSERRHRSVGRWQLDIGQNRWLYNRLASADRARDDRSTTPREQPWGPNHATREREPVGDGRPSAPQKPGWGHCPIRVFSCVLRCLRAFSKPINEVSFPSWIKTLLPSSVRTLKAPDLGAEFRILIKRPSFNTTLFCAHYVFLPKHPARGHCNHTSPVTEATGFRPYVSSENIIITSQ
jgi:hypothetical protein